MSVIGEMLDHSVPAPDTCPECGAYDCARAEEKTTYTIHPELALTVTYKFPAYTCSCGFAWTGYEEEDAELRARLKVVEAKLLELWSENKALHEKLATASTGHTGRAAGTEKKA